MPVHIEGKDLPIGKYDFHRYMTYNGEKQKINTYHIEKTKDGYEFFKSSIKIDDEIRRIELKKLIKSINILGKIDSSNKLKLLIYDDGSVVKKYKY